MAHIVLTLSEWHAIAHALRGAHQAAAPAELHERLHAFFQEAPRGWHDRPYAIDLDAASIEAVWAMHASLTSGRPAADGYHTSVLAAMQIIYQPVDDSSLASQ